jgi:type IV pilus assembly protein PilW
MRQAHRPVPGARRMRGLTLVELLVSLGIGLVLMLAIVSAYLGASSASSATQAQGRMNEDAQAALSILSQHIRMAHSNPKQPSYAPGTPRNPAFAGDTWAIRGCDMNFTAGTMAGTTAALECTATGDFPSVADSLSVAYEADKYNTVKNAAGNATDCVGSELPVVNANVSTWTGGAVAATAVTYRVAESRFYIDTPSGSSTPSLYCKGNGTASTAQPLVENVENMQLTYGVAPSTAVTTLTVAGYLTAAQVAVLATPANDKDRWEKVATVRICIIVRSEQAAAPTPDSAKYFDCSAALIDPGDLRLRRAYSTTVVLRNRIAS